MDETRMTASLPQLDVEITRRASDDGAAEIVTMTVRAAPDLNAVARMMAPQMLLLPMMAANPFLAAWTQVLRQAWSPWTALPHQKD